MQKIGNRLTKILNPTIFRIFSGVAILVFILFTFSSHKHPSEEILSYTVDPKSNSVKLYWKDAKGNLLGSLQGLKNYVETKKEELLFATNGGMYIENQSPLGLFIQEGKTLRGLNTGKGKGNFHTMPNGVFYLTADKTAGVCKTGDFVTLNNIHYATQSGPLLLIAGDIHPAFTKGSQNLNIRNGVGILADGKIIFAMSKEGINFYDFAMYFKNLGCKNALYLDGFVSRTYLPEKNWEQLDGSFGVMIGIAK